jgi:ribokinase
VNARHSSEAAPLPAKIAVVVTFGSINVDLTVPVPSLPRPGETVLGGDYRLVPGGKGANQALAARRAGARVFLAGAIGSDYFGEVALGQLRRDGVDTHLVRVAEAPTGCAAVMVSPTGENMIAVAPGANARVRSDQVVDEVIDAETILVAQAEVPIAETNALIRRVRARGGTSLLNLAPALPIDPDLYTEIDLLIVNETEAATIGRDPESLAGSLRRGLVITLGSAGAIAFLSNGDRLEVPALRIEPVDTTGAGDTFVGVLAASLDAGSALEPALRRASVAAGLACLTYGAQSGMPHATAIDTAMNGLPFG